MKSKFKNVAVEYTGGGIWIFQALYNDEVWILTSFDLSGSYARPYEMIDTKTGKLTGESDVDAPYKEPSIPYPTWNQILRQVKKVEPLWYDEIASLARYYNPGEMGKPILDLGWSKNS